MPLNQRPKVFISCGELSGDLLAADLVDALRACGDIEISAICGPHLRSRVSHCLADLSELNVMGVTEVLFRAHDIYLLIERLLDHVRQHRPDLVILVDFPGFHFRLAEALRSLRVPVVQYVAPKVWAWGKGRVKKLRRDFSHVLGILPFEEEFFQKHEVPYTYIGCPIVERTQAYRKVNQDEDVIPISPLVGLFPGSRRGEVSRLLRRQLALAAAVKARLPLVRFVVSVADSLHKDWVAAQVDEACKTLSLPSSSSAAFPMEFAVIASGTATLECALVGTPQMVVYEMGAVNYQIAKAFVDVPFISLVNLIAGREVVKEFVQLFPISSMADEVCAALTSKDKRARIKRDYEEIRSLLGCGGSRNAADWLWEHYLEKPAGRSRGDLVKVANRIRR
jgi:lipid-A-disaccharide synthase